MRQEKVDILERFNDSLAQIWFLHNIKVWKHHKKLSSLQGEAMKTFVTNTNKMAAFLWKEFAETQWLKTIYESLTTWTKICEFINVTKIQDEATYPKQLEEFESNVKNSMKMEGTGF